MEDLGQRRWLLADTPKSAERENHSMAEKHDESPEPDVKFLELEDLVFVVRPAAKPETSLRRKRRLTVDTP